MPHSKHATPIFLFAVCALAIGLRLYHLGAPIADNLHAKQAYSSNKARNIARVPFDPMRLSLDLLDDTGAPMQLAEEVPVYISALAALFRIFGESEACGRLLSIAGSVCAVLAFFALARREHGRRVARSGTLILACMPLFVFYGRAVMPDSWMLAAMLGTAAAFRRYLDSTRLRWLLAAMVCGALTVLVKYWGLMIVFVLADMHRAKHGGRAWLRLDFVALNLAISLPTALWMLLVFAPAPNPVQNGWVAGQPPSPYLVFQAPGALTNRAFYAAFVSRLLVRDCGPITALLMVCGAIAVWRRTAPERLNRGALWRWTLMAIAFFVLLAPKMIDHDYYELMMLPAAALWASAGFCAILDRFQRFVSPRRTGLLRAALVTSVVVVHSPWVNGGLFRLEMGKFAFGLALARSTPPEARVVALGPPIALIVPIHYSQRSGWAVRAETLPDGWPDQLRAWRNQGARVVGLYFNHKTKPAQRQSYQKLIDALPILEHRRVDSGIAESRFEYVVLRLEDGRLANLDDARSTVR
jgi:hypothetical protein